MRVRPFTWLVTLTLLSVGCTPFRLLFGREERKPERFKSPRQVRAADIAMAEGYRIEVVAIGLNAPSSLLFDEENRVYVTESGPSGSVEARLLRVDADGSSTEVFKESSSSWRGGVFAGGSLYLSSGNRLIRRSKEGKTEILAEGLNLLTRPVLGTDHALYFGQRDPRAIMRCPLGGKPELFARIPDIPTALAFAPNGTLYAASANASAFFWKIRRDAQPERVAELKTPSLGFDFSRNLAFGHTGHAKSAFLAQNAWIARLDPETGTVEDFAWNLDGKGPASRLGSFGIEHPIDVRFDRTGNQLFLLDSGVTGVERTGVLWKITQK